MTSCVQPFSTLENGFSAADDHCHVCSDTPSGNVKNDDADTDAKSLCVSSDTLNFIQLLCKPCILSCFLFWCFSNCS